jgi:L-Lysine epsilon oxidase N-terminal
MSEEAQTGETTIVRAAIYPAVGIARVGNSESEYYLAPEVADPPTAKAATSRLPLTECSSPASICRTAIPRLGRSSTTSCDGSSG